MASTISSRKAKTFLSKWNDAGYKVKEVESYKHQRTTVAMLAYVEETKDGIPDKNPAELAAEQNLYVFVEEASGVLGRAYFYDRTGINKLKSACGKMATQIESMPEFLQEDEDMREYRNTYKLIGHFLNQAVENVRLYQYHDAHLKLVDAIQQSKLLEANRYAHIKETRIPDRVRAQFFFLKTTFSVLTIAEK